MAKVRAELLQAWPPTTSPSAQPGGPGLAEETSVSSPQGLSLQEDPSLLTSLPGPRALLGVAAGVPSRHPHPDLGPTMVCH